EQGDNFTPDVIAGNLKDRGLINESEHDAVAFDDTGDALVKLLNSKGYDGLVYKNTGEVGGPSDSYVIFNKGQVHAIPELRTGSIPKTQPSGDILPMEEEIRRGAGGEGAAQKETQKGQAPQ